MRTSLFNLLKDDLPDSCFGQFQEKKRFVKARPTLPPSILEGTLHEIAKPGYTLESVLEAQTVTREVSNNISNATIAQASSEVWHAQRKGRITASIFHRVASRVRTLEKMKMLMCLP